MKRIDPRKWAGAFRSVGAPHALEQWQWRTVARLEHVVRVESSRVRCVRSDESSSLRNEKQPANARHSPEYEYILISPHNSYSHQK